MYLCIYHIFQKPGYKDPVISQAGFHELLPAFLNTAQVTSSKVWIDISKVLKKMDFRILIT